MSTIIIERRYNFDDYEQIATYDTETGDLDGDEDFIEAFDYLFEDEVFDADAILERFSGPNLIANIPDDGEEWGVEGEEVEASAEKAESVETVEIDKYRVYLGEAESLAEAEEEAPDWANVQQGAQGGFFYDTEDKEDGGSDGEMEFDGIVSGGVDDGGYAVDRSVDPGDVEEGDSVYVSHPTSANYIADVDSVSTFDDGGWSIDFGGGSYTLREDTNSTYEGLVEEQPELGEYEDVESVDFQDIEEGDVVSYTDPAGYQHYVEVDAVHISPPADASEVETEAGRLAANEINGRVEINDPIEQYDLPDEDWIEENTQIGNVDAARTFVEEVAKATAEGDASSVSCRDYQYYVGAIRDEEMMIDVFRSAVNNDASATHRDKIESRMRSMGLVPENHHPHNIEYDPDEVPDERKGTKFSTFDSEQATNSVAHAIQENNISSTNWAEWNDFFDHMTEAELEESIVKALTQEIDRPNWGSDPMNYEGDSMSISENSPELYSADRKNGAACLTRLSDDPDRQREVYDRLMEETQYNRDTAKLCASWMPSAEVRREIVEEEGIDVETTHQGNRFTMQFHPDHEERARAFLSNYVGSTGGQDTQVARAMLGQYDVNEDTEVSKFNKGLSNDFIEPTEEFEETIDQLREETAQHIEQEHGGEVVLKRGLQEPISSNASAESWTDDHQTASGHFDGHAVIEAVFEPGDVIGSHEISNQYDLGYHKHSTEHEWTVLGGPLTEAIPDGMRPDEFFAEETAAFDADQAHPTADVE